ncbi:MAG: LTA synthase family protein [Bifidobacterium sp.]|nr:LTA synthase family protein [Bifidobacterium sp.]
MGESGPYHNPDDEGEPNHSPANDATEAALTADTANPSVETGAERAAQAKAERAGGKRKRQAPKWYRDQQARYARFKESKFYRVWNKRPKWGYGWYAVVAIALIEIANMMVLWSADTSLNFDPSGKHSFMGQIFYGTYNKLTDTAGIMNTIALVMIYLICVTLVNRFWVGTAIFGAFSIVYAVADKIKVTMRQEPIIPSDLSFLSGNGGGGENIASFITDSVRPTLNAGLRLLLWFVIICVAMQWIDRRRAFIHCSWKHPFANVKNIFGTICRVLAPILSITLIVSYAGALGNPNGATRKALSEIGYEPRLWNVMDDAKNSGALSTFLNLTDVKAMDKEADYSRATMDAIRVKYEKEAEKINAERTQQLTDSTVINVLSESFSDPERVPGVHYDIDPMPYIRSLKGTTTTGLMLSPGYGGGTANIEFQQMTGLSMANFATSMLSPYQQLVATRSRFYSFNQMWNEACGSDSCSVGFHPYLQSFYLRGVNYKKFGFSHLYTLDSDPQISHQGKYKGELGETTTVTDEQAYLNVLDEVKANAEQNKPAQYIELVTMQNHAPYPDVYGSENEFHAANKSAAGALKGDEIGVVDNYVKGVQRTDEATKQFLEELDKIDKPITVVFYGDHLPGIYSTAASDSKNDITLHETDYFIWSNKASSSHDKKLPESNAAYTSSNYFMAQAADQLDAKVSPYLALLTELHEAVPALSRSVTEGGVWNATGSSTLLDDQGQPIDTKDLSEHAKELLKDYKMVQYDMTVGDNFLWDAGFMNLPKS